jgi:HSP20 family protein
MLSRMNPFRQDRFREELERAFDRAWFGGPGTLTEVSEMSPLLDLEEEDDTYVLRVEVPGMSRDDLEVHLEGDQLVIEGERREENKRRRRMSEIYYGHVYRTMTLPQDADPEGIKTRLRRGVLEVTIPRQQQASRRFEVLEEE